MTLYAYVCPECGEQSRAPGSHHVAGDDCCTSCLVGARFSRRDGISPQPKLRRIEVIPLNGDDNAMLERGAVRRKEAYDDFQASLAERRAKAKAERGASG